MIEALLDRFDLTEDVVSAARRAIVRLQEKRRPREDLRRERVHAKVLRAFFDEGLAESDLDSTFGYGYGDPARGRYESLLTRVLDAERALAQLSFVSGTHAIFASIAALADPGSLVISATGRPYDTLRNALADADDSLAGRGVRYEEIPLGAGGTPDLAAVAERSAASQPSVVFVQRSRGYAPRASLPAEECGAIARRVHEASPETVVLVDNCYGELVDEGEPTAFGVDVIAGSLIKNLGGGLAPGGGYVAGRAGLVQRIAERHTAPGLGREVGSTLGFGRQLIQGLWLAPLAVAESLAGLDFAAALFAELGFPVDPEPAGPRHDVIQAIALGSRERLLAFARGLQSAMPLNARFSPEPGTVPGYPGPVIMSSGAFISGATIELSCDAPLRMPYEVYLQGGLTREHVVLGALFAAERLAQEKLLMPRTSIQ